MEYFFSSLKSKFPFSMIRGLTYISDEWNMTMTMNDDEWNKTPNLHSYFNFSCGVSFCILIWEKHPTRHPHTPPNTSRINLRKTAWTKRNYLQCKLLIWQNNVVQRKTLCFNILPVQCDWRKTTSMEIKYHLRSHLLVKILCSFPITLSPFSSPNMYNCSLERKHTRERNRNLIRIESTMPILPNRHAEIK